MAEEEDAPVRKRLRLEKLYWTRWGWRSCGTILRIEGGDRPGSKANIGRKQGHSSAAEAFFRKS